LVCSGFFNRDNGAAQDFLEKKQKRHGFHRVHGLKIYEVSEIRFGYLASADNRFCWIVPGKGSIAGEIFQSVFPVSSKYFPWDRRRLVGRIERKTTVRTLKQIPIKFLCSQLC
jgi:hypothetical protein